MSVYDWSTTATNNATADAAINWAENQPPSTVNNSARAMMAAVKSWQLDLSGLTLGGTGDAFALTPAQALPSLTNAVIGFFATRTNTGAVTLAVSGLTAKPLRSVSGTALSSGHIKSGSFYLCAYNTSTEEWLIIGSLEVKNSDLATMANNTVKANISGSTATPSDVSLSSFFGAAPAQSVALTSVAGIANGRLLVNISGATASPAAATISTTFDALIGSTQGSIVYRNASGWVALTPGTANQVLATGGAGANPAWLSGSSLFFPSRTGNAGKFLQTNGTTDSWATVGPSARAIVTDGLSSTCTLSDADNISGITQSGGDYSVTWGTAFADTDYYVDVQITAQGATNDIIVGSIVKTTTGCTITTRRGATAGKAAVSSFDIRVFVYA